MVASTSSLHDGGLVHQAVAGSVVVRRVDQGQGDSERVVIVLEAPYNDIASQAKFEYIYINSNFITTLPQMVDAPNSSFMNGVFVSIQH